MSADSIEKIADDSLTEFYKQVTDSAPLMDRLKEARERIGKMCSERRGPRMSIPVQWYDDDVFICKTIEDAIDALASLAELERDAGGVLGEVLAEVERAIRKFPTWPTDPLHALAVLGEEFGELTKEALQLVYEPHKASAAEVRKEAIQTAAMALRWVNSIDRYEYTRGEQHEQKPLGAKA